MREPDLPLDAGGMPDEAITPIAYSPPEQQSLTRRRGPPRGLGLGTALLAVLLFAWFLLGARAMQLQVTPAAATVDIDGGLSLRLGARVLMRPGEYRANATADGYRPLTRTFTVNRDGDQHLVLALEKLPGLLRLETTPVAAKVIVDGEAAGNSNGAPLELAAGTHALRLEAERYRVLEQTVDIEGMGREQSLTAALQPAWGNYRIVTEPVGATVLLDGEALGTTPTTAELVEGSRQLRLTLAGYRDENIVVAAVAGENRELTPLVLVRADARVQVSSRPEGASITLDGVFQGRSPLELTLQSGTAHELIAFRAGYERAVRRFTAAQGTQQVVLALPSLQGEVQINVVPEDAVVYSGSRQLATGSARLSLPATAQTLSVRREGFASSEISVTPRPGFPQEVTVRLRTLEQTREAAVKARLTSSAGQELVLLKPGPFRMGSSRREVGRRANEGLREVRLTRAFYLGVAEVSNAQFRQFRAAHSSGNFKGKSLNGDEQPATGVSWTDAALYCNWLSEREGLPPFYRVAGKAVTGAERASRGYRLPTEAEWAWAASVRGGGPPARFPWGESLPPPAKAGNYADRSGESLLGTVISGYDDGFAVAAPMRRFTANRHGLFDLGGNAAEWVHDLYEAAPPPGAAVETDPLGPDIGEFHVIRGASWRHGSVTELRLAYRDYGKDGRADLGFRIARYAE